MSSTEPQSIYLEVDHNPVLAQGSGTVDAIISIAVRARTGTSRPDLTLRVWTPAGAVIGFMKQVGPTIDDLTYRRVGIGGQTGEYPLGTWGAEDRDYHIQVEVEPAAAGREKLAARVGVIAGDEVLGEGLVKVVWTTDTAVSAQISPLVAHYTGQTELAQALDDGFSARESGDIPTATAALQRAMALALESGNAETAKLLKGVIEVDENTGTARLRREDASVDDALDARSTKTARVRKET